MIFEGHWEKKGRIDFMTIEELYESIGANYKDAIERLVSEKFITKYIIKFLEDDSYNNLMTAWKEHKSDEEMFRAAHTLKGVCLNFALDALFVPTNIITDHYRENGGHKVENLEEVFAELESVYNEMVVKIKEFAEERK